jgi:AmmeMemoRadiSam system protein B
MTITISYRTDLDFIPVEDAGERLFLIRDPLGLVAEGAALPAVVATIMALFDGTRSEADVLAELTRRQGGELFPAEDLKQLIDELAAAYILDTPAYRAARDALVAEFAASPVRESALAGRAYPDEPGECAAYLDAILGEGAAALETAAAPKALVAPHIDLEAGRQVYARAYGALAGVRPTRVVVLGVGHQLETLFAPTAKSFRTPLGEVRTDAAAVARLAAACPDLGPEAEFVHKSEHSVEFQALLLSRLLGAETFSLVPVLCGSLSGLPEYSRQAFRDAAGPFLEALAAIVAEPGTLVVAGVDFCHIGPKFGHEQSGRELEEPAAAHDRALLGHLAAGDAEAFWAESRRVKNAFHVCGFTALATLLEILPAGLGGRVLDHQVWHEGPTESAVGFAAAVFGRE